MDACFMAFRLLLVVSFVCGIILPAMGFSMHIVPHRHTPASPGEVVIACTVEAREVCDHRSFMVLEVRRDKESRLAFVEQPSSIQYTVDTPRQYKVQGLLVSRGYSGFLNVSIPAPVDSDQGIYTCTARCLYDLGVVVERTLSTNLSVETGDMVKALEVIDNEIKTMPKDFKAKVGKALDVIWARHTKALDKQIRHQTIDILGLKHKESKPLAFSAALKEHVKSSGGDVIVFSDVTMNHGDAYEPRTGVFTAPRAGAYAFELALNTDSRLCDNLHFASEKKGKTNEKGEMPTGCHGEVFIQAKDDKIVSLGFDKSGKRIGDHSSVKAVRELKAGDKIRVVADSTFHWDGGRGSSNFQGYVIQFFE